MQIESIVELGKYGVIGVMLALILLILFTFYLFWKFAANHIEHSNCAFREVAAALAEFKQYLKDSFK